MSLRTRKAPAPIAINLMQENIPGNSNPVQSNIPFKYFSKTAFDALQEAVCLADMNLNVIYCNRKMAQISGRSQKQAIGASLLNLLPERFHSHFHSKIEFVIHSGDRVSGEFLHKEDDSNRLIYQYEISVQEAEKAKSFLMVSITTLSDSQQQYAAKEEVQHVSNISDLILSISQELALPLNQVCMHIDNIIELLGNFQNSRLDVHLNGIISQVYRISSLAHNLAALSKRAVPTYVNLNINEIILDAIENCEQDWGKRVAMNLHLDENLPSIQGDPFLLTSAFQNIIRVADELAGDDAVPRLNTGLSRSKKYVAAVFETRGHITPPEELNKLFVLIQGNKKLSPGGSLGLYISKKMLEAQQCKISMATDNEAGTIITLSIPVFSFIKKLHQKQI